MFSWNDIAMKEEMRQDMLRAAAHRTLVAQALAARPPVGWRSQALVQLGRRLETWGQRLQIRYAQPFGGLARAHVLHMRREATRTNSLFRVASQILR
jgi:hypothetical protein